MLIFLRSERKHDDHFFVKMLNMMIICDHLLVENLYVASLFNPNEKLNDFAFAFIFCLFVKNKT